MIDNNTIALSGKEIGYLDMELLRFTTAGSVDDGKSTLIGRLLFDSKAIFEDQMEAIERASISRGGEEVNLALLTDGLRAEREQGITIDVAYRYFATPKRKFIIADTPGHIQYTRNMVTGASTANAAVILIDARNGVIEQTRRHAYIAALLQIPHVVVCVNKMDLVDFSQEVFEAIKTDFTEVAHKLGNNDVHFLPISAKLGDNVVDRSNNMPWYTGQTFIGLMEEIPVGGDHNFKDPRFPVQYVIRPQSDQFHDYRGYAGRVAGGIFTVGQEVVALPGGQKTTIEGIDFGKVQLERAFAPQSVTLRLAHEIDISRGSMIVDAVNQPLQGQEIDLMVCWLNSKPLQIRGKYLLKHTSNEMKCVVTEVAYKVNINTLEELHEDKNIGLNEIAKISIKTTRPIFYDSYKRNRDTGSLILIDEGTNNVVGAGMIL
ncbi:MAG: GTP-binding protein [Prolixibacteraceae bacterium]